MSTDAPLLLTLTNALDGSAVVLRPRALVLAGYTGRDRASVQRHIDELAAHGVAPPERVPMLYRGLPEQIQIDGELPPAAGWSSGEVEFVLFVTAAGVFVGVGSDHTDRDLEQTSVIDSKRACAKVIGARVWPLHHLAATWDTLTLRSWITCGGRRSVYQRGRTATMMTPSALLRLVPVDERGPGLVLFSGTVPAAEAAPPHGTCTFEGELVAANGHLLTSCSYTYHAR